MNDKKEIAKPVILELLYTYQRFIKGKKVVVKAKNLIEANKIFINLTK